MKTPFVHLHVHSHYSLLDGLGKPEKAVKKAAEMGCSAIALTDHGVMHGHIEFFKACKKHNIKPIVGCEVYIAFNKLTDKRHQIDNKRYHLTLLAETQEGYENLLKMATVAHLDGYYYKPRVDWDLIRKHSKGLIALCGALNGELAESILGQNEPRIKELIQRFNEVFGKENFFFELQHHPRIPSQKVVNEKLIELGKEHNVGLVATNDSHYPNPEDNEAQDILLCIQTARNLDDTGRFSMMNSDYSLRTPEQMWEAFGDTPEALENTVKIAERCHVNFEFGKYLIPVFPTPDNKDPSEYLKELCYQGLIDKYKVEIALEDFIAGKFTDEKSPLGPTCKELAERLDYELGIINEMGFVGYFLIVWDFVKWAKDNGIVVGPGRGSAAGAIVAYALDITEIDPLKYSLLFERFLNPARVSMPDIDLDFDDNRRDEVIDYVAQKYGRDRVAQICTFGTLAARAAVKDVGRVLGVSFADMNHFAKLIPEKPGTKLNEALEQSSELVEAIESSDTYKQVMDNALKLEGAVRHVSVHACGVIIADESLTKYTALQHPPKDDKGIITQYEAKSLESLGLLKMDFLGLKNLTILQTTLKIIEKTKGVKIDRHEIPIDDAKAYALLSRGETTGVFQLESAGMKRYLKELKPTEFEDIIAMVSLYRPGPMEWIPDYIKGKHGKIEVKYLHPSLEPLLNKTYGIAIYQEQILQIAQEFSGFSLGEADILRRAIGKKIISELEAQKEKFIKGAVEKGYSESLAVMIFEKVIEPFAGYGFNKSHAACYAMIAYQTAYLKAHYPTQFMTALMSADRNNTDRIVIEIEEAEQMGIQVLPPDVNESLDDFTYVEDGKIRFGLSAIKGLGNASVKHVIEARTKGDRFKNIEDFSKRVPSKILNKKTVEALAFSGAMGELGERKQIGLNYELLADFGKKAEKSHHEGQAGLFDHIEDEAIEESLKLPDTQPATPAEKLKWEKEFLGLYVSAHPLGGLKPFFKTKVVPLNQLVNKSVNKSIKVGGMIQSVRKVNTKKGDVMAILQIEDPFHKTEVVLFPKTYQKFSDQLVEDRILLIEGILDRRMGEMQIIAKKMEGFSIEEMQQKAKKLGLWKDAEKTESSSDESVSDSKEIKQVEEVSSVNAQSVHAVESHSSAEDIYSILITKKVDKNFFIKLKELLKKHPGNQKVELVIEDQVLPVSLKVDLGSGLKDQVEELIQAV